MCDLVEGWEANESGPIPKWCPLKDTPDKDYPDHPCKFAGTCDYILMICDECTEKETRWTKKKNVHIAITIILQTIGFMFVQLVV